MQFKTKVALFVLIDLLLCVALFLYGIMGNNFNGCLEAWAVIPIVIIGTLIYLSIDRHVRNKGERLQRRNRATVISKYSETEGVEYVTTTHYVTFEIESEGRVTFNVANPGKYIEGDKGMLTYTVGKDYDTIIQFDRY